MRRWLDSLQSLEIHLEIENLYLKFVLNIG